MVAKFAALQETYVTLDFTELPLCGRDEQLRTLHGAYQDVVEHGSLRVVEIKGLSGMGKTSLVEALRDQLGAEDEQFVSGKYHKEQEMPYAALAYALSHLCDKILQSDRATEVSDALRKALHQDKEVLCNVIPNLDQLVGKTDEGASSDKLYMKDWGFERLKTLFRDFLRVVASAEHPLVVFLDDLQWADEACLNLLSFLCIDRETKGLLLVASYREDEVKESHLLTTFLRTVRGELGK